MKNKEEGGRPTSGNLTPKTPALDFLCEELSAIQPTPEELQEVFLAEHHAMPTTSNLAAWLLSERHTQLRIERLCKQYNQFVSVFYLKQTTTAGEYVFFQHPPRANILFRKRKNGKSAGEVDLVMMVEGCPVIVETDLSQYNNSGRLNDIAEMLRPEKIEKKKRPMQQLFGKPPEIIYVIPSDYLGKIRIPESNLHKFVQNGGHIVPFYTTREQWRRDAESMVAQQRLYAVAV